MTEHELIQRALVGDAKAFEDLVAGHLPPAYRTALLMTNGYDSAQEAVQEALIEAFRSLPRFRSGAPFRPWFMKLVIHRALNQNRRARRVLTFDDIPEPAASQGNPEARVLESEKRKAIWQAIQQLDFDHRTVVVLHYYQDCSVAEIAAILEIPRGTVKSRLHTARRRIEKAFETSSATGEKPLLTVL